jgi:hypothetical protein
MKRKPQAPRNCLSSGNKHRTPNPATGSTVPLVTDRALRYRAQKNTPPGPRVCAYCGAAAGTVEIEHVDGEEANTDPSNLLWACRSCNTQKGIAFREEGVGRPIRQFNPAAADLAELRAQMARDYRRLDAIMETGRGEKEEKALRARLAAAEKRYARVRRQAAKRTKNPHRPAAAGTLKQWKAATTSLLGLGPWTPAAAIHTVHATPPARRAAFAEQLRKQRTKNPGAASSGAYFDAINILRGNQPGDAAKARELIDATPASDRSNWTRAAWRTRREVYGPSGRQASLFGGDVPF